MDFFEEALKSVDNEYLGHLWFEENAYLLENNVRKNINNSIWDELKENI